MTGTVESIPLIASSIMSKKIAEGTAALVLDVKVGGGAFMPDLPRARELARTMVGIGEDNGVRTAALLTDMDAPLGRTVGNALEVREALEVLEGGGPPDVVEVTLALAGEMLMLAGIDADPAAALADGRAMDRWRRMIRAQGGDPDAPLPVAPLVEEVRAAGGRARASTSTPWPWASRRGGSARAGRQRGHPVSPGAGVMLRAAPGRPGRGGPGPGRAARRRRGPPRVGPRGVRGRVPGGVERPRGGLRG